jgi:hypothetical protein
VNNKFRLNQKGEKILRLKCIIESLRIERIDYRLNELQSQEIILKDFFSKLFVYII